MSFYPDPNEVAMEGHPAVSVVENELTAIQQEMALAELWEKRAAYARIRHEFIRELGVTVSSRRAMQEFTKKQMKLGEQILARLHFDRTSGNT